MASMELIDSATGQLRTATTADLGGGSGGGSSASDPTFTQLTQSGAAVSNTNRLPTEGVKGSSANILALITVSGTVTALVGANSNRISFRVRNSGLTEVAIGTSGVTWDNRVIVLSPGDVWVEDDAPGIAWSAVCASGTTSFLAVQEVLK